MQEHPVVMVTYSIEIDVLIAPLIQECWRLGWHTRYCCQGDPEGTVEAQHRSSPKRNRRSTSITADMAYIAFRGPDAPRFLAAILAVDPLWPHRLEDADVIRFPQEGIAVATQVLKELAHERHQAAS